MSTEARNKIEKAVIDCLRKLAREKFPSALSPDDIVLDACGLDSLHGVELACDLGAELSIDIPLKDNPLVDGNESNERRRARTLSEVVDYLEAIAKQ